MECMSVIRFLCAAIAITLHGVQETALHTARCPDFSAEGNATWLVRDADTYWSLNHTAITAIVRLEIGNWRPTTPFRVLTGTTNAFGEISLPLYDLAFEMTFEVVGYYPLTLRNVKLDQNPCVRNTFMETLMFIPKRFSGPGTEMGRLRDFSNYTTLGGVKLDFRTDMNSHTGTVVHSVTTSAGGLWSATLPTGHYTMTVSKDGYITVPYTVVILGGQMRGFGDTGLSPTLERGAFRVVSLKRIDVLGYCPAIHVRGPAEDQSGRAHTYRENRASPDGLVKYEVSDWYIESLLVTKQLPGVYRISVSDYQTLAGYRSGALSDIAESNGLVHLYTGNRLSAQYSVPNRQGNAWSLVDIDGMLLQSINSLKTVTSVEDVD